MGAAAMCWSALRQRSGSHRPHAGRARRAAAPHRQMASRHGIAILIIMAGVDWVGHSLLDPHPAAGRPRRGHVCQSSPRPQSRFPAKIEGLPVLREMNLTAVEAA